MYRCMGCMREYSGGADTCPHCGYVHGTPPREAYHLLPETILNGRYIAGRVLGYGGFGVTYVGWDAQLERKVAIKEFLPSMFATRMPGHSAVTVYTGAATEQFGAGLRRFVEEAQLLAQFNGVPGIVDIYDTFVDNNTAYIVMQFLDGGDVKAFLAANGPMGYERAREIILEICDTLEPVHEAGIIHRDISPDNIFLTKDGEIKLLDFGASRYASNVNSKSLSVILKAGYAPEEQYRSRGDQGSWSDVYALAATFYKMLTGQTPMDSMERAINDELPEPSKLGVQMPQSAENALMNALNIRKENRTQTVAEFKSELMSDGVERQKEKLSKTDTGKMPGWAKVLVGGAAAFVLVFVLLTATGVISFEQGSFLGDIFGSSVPEGHVNVPGVLNQTEDEARRLINEAGLEFIIVGVSYDDQVEKGLILSQEPLPGRVIALGEAVEVRINAGSRADALASGELSFPDLSYKTLPEALYLLEEADYEPVICYEYDDSLAAGLVIGYEDIPPDYDSVLLTISAGKDDVPGKYGEMRAPSINSSNGIISAVIASVSNERLEGLTYRVAFSADGGDNWAYVRGAASGFYEQSAPEYMSDGENGNVPVEELGIGYLIAAYHPEALGKELIVRIERYVRDIQTWEQTMLDFIQLDQRLTIYSDGAAPKIEALRDVDWDAVGSMNSDGSLPDGIIKKYYEAGSTENRSVISLEGGFSEGKSYSLMENNSYTEYRSVKDGELLIIEPYYSSSGVRSYNLRMIACHGGSTDERGDVTIHFSPLLESAVHGDDFLEEMDSVLGLSVPEAVEIIKPQMDPDAGYFNYSAKYDPELPYGSVSGWTPGRTNPSGQFISGEIQVNYNPGDVNPVVMTLHTYATSYTDDPYANVVIGYMRAGWTENCDSQYFMSFDSGKTWEELLRYTVIYGSDNTPSNYIITSDWGLGDWRFEEKGLPFDGSVPVMGKVRLYNGDSDEVLSEVTFEFPLRSEADRLIVW